MGSDAAFSVTMCICAAAVLLADGERQRASYVRAMRRCLMRMNDIIRYERPPLAQLLRRIELKGTRQERELTRMLHACADRLEHCANPQLLNLFAGESARRSTYGVLSGEDREAFEGILAELGRCGLAEQLRLIGEADERLRAREEILNHESRQRARLIRTLGFAGGAAVFLILI